MHEVAGQVLETLRATGWRSDAHGVTASGRSRRIGDDWQHSIQHWLDHPDDNKVVMAISIVLDSRVVQARRRLRRAGPREGRGPAPAGAAACCSGSRSRTSHQPGSSGHRGGELG